MVNRKSMRSARKPRKKRRLKPEKIIANAHKTIDLEREKTVQDLQTQIAGLAMMAAGKVLGKADAAEQNKLMYEQFLAKTGGCNDTDSK